MMSPFIHTLPGYEIPKAAQTTPELRRMEMYNRARREEMDSMLFSMSQRRTAASGGIRKSVMGNVLNSLRFGIGSALISVGNRIQSPA